MNRPYVLLSVATSLDGHIDDARPERLILSNAEDLDRVDAERAAADAILVGAATIAADDPRLLVRSAARRAERVARGTPPSPIKVTITRSGRGLDPRARFFTAGDGLKLVYAQVPAPNGAPSVAAPSVAAAEGAPSVAAPNVAAPNVAAPNVAAPNVAAPNVAAPNVAAPNVAASEGAPSVAAPHAVAPSAGVAPVAAAEAAAPDAAAPDAARVVADLERRLAGLATVVVAPDLPSVLTDLAARGVARLMVEGGTRTTTAFLAAGLVDELQVVVAPLVVGDPSAPRLAAAPVHRMELVDLRCVGDCALLVYRPRRP